jgi:NAD(P)-dependent dehydrogenase (short-subunit alcohol dehydrogenase family)
MNIFITGGISGIGLEVGKLLAQEGAQIGVCSFQPKSEIQNLPANFHYYQADVTVEEQVIQAIDAFVNTFGVLDVVYANAGLNMPKTAIPDTKLGTKVTKVNVLGVINTFNAALPHFLQQKSGHFVAISSLSGLNGLPGMSYYGASKAFVTHFCESLALDLKDYNIDVTCITPGFVKTEFTKNNKNPMPFLMTVDFVAQKIVEAIKSKKEFVAFPFVPFTVMSLISKLPKALYYPIMRRDLFKLRYKD